MLASNTKSISGLFGDVVEQFGQLVRTEVRLAQAEFSERLDEAVKGAAYMAAAGLVMIPVLVMLLMALAIGLTQMGMQPAISYLIAAAVGGAISGILLMSGLSRLKARNLKLKKTMQQIHQDLAAARTLAK
jgi:membrane associated rhomboid family serine protease